MELVTAKRAADELGVDERTIRRWIARGDLQAVKRGGAFMIDIEVAREVHGRSRPGQTVARSVELAELRGRYLEVAARLAQAERDLADERRRAAKLEAILEAQAA